MLFSAGARGAVATNHQQVPNVATLNATGLDNPIDSAPATITVRIKTQAVLELLEYAPGSAQAKNEAVAPGSWIRSDGTVMPLAPPQMTGAATPINLAQPVPLVPTAFYHQGDPVFIRVTDADQNQDPVVRESVDVTVTDDLTGDVEIVRLTEDGPDTGVFVGYLPTQRSGVGMSTQRDGTLQVVERSKLVAKYSDPYSGDALAVAAGVDPLGLVFDSHTGKPVNGAQVTLIDDATSLPATVFSDDGISSWPSTVVSGGTVTDGGGRTQVFQPGEFRFPFLKPGTYHFVVKPPPGYVAPTQLTTAALQSVPNGPFTIVEPASRGGDFTLTAGPAVHVDIPIDPHTVSLWVRKTAEREVAGIGEAIAYDISVTNTDTAIAAPGTQAIDRLPPGFRYRRGSTQIDGVAAPDPAVTADGRQLAFDVGQLDPSATVTIRFVATIGAGAQVGTQAVNQATAASAVGSTSNLAEASVKVLDDFFSTRSFVLGHVTTGPCDAASGEGDTGVAGVRVVLEDGTFAISDRKGLFHFEGLKPGLHVVQLDLDSLPEGYEAVSCVQNDRFAGRAFSQFVEVKGQSVWRADFHLRAPPPPPPPPPPPAPGDASLELTHTLEKDVAVFVGKARGARSPLGAATMVIELPAPLAYVPGSATVDAVPVSDPAVAAGKLTFILGAVPADWDRTISFRANLGAHPEPQQLAVTASLPALALTAGNIVRVTRQLEFSPVTVVMRPHFASFGTKLSKSDTRQLDELAHKLLRIAPPHHVAVVGHTDSVPISKKAQKKFKDNIDLSLARARSVGEYLIKRLGLPQEALELVGNGETTPIATNKTSKGRALNRRVEVQAFAARGEATFTLRTIKGESGASHVQTRLVDGVASVVPPAGAVDAAAQGQGAGPIAVPATALSSATPAVAASGSSAALAAAATPVPNGAPLASPRTVLAANADGFVSPIDGDLIPDRIAAVQVRATSYLMVQLLVDGKQVDATRIGYKSEDPATGKTTYTFIGVDLGDRGAHVLTLVGKDPFGNERLRKTAKVERTGEIARIRFVSADDNVADGRTPIRARIELLDAQNVPIRGSARLEIKSGNLQRYRREGENLSLDESLGRMVQADRDGNVEFAPVSASGSYQAVLALGSATVQIETWAQPKMRDWILVGLAEGTAGYNVVTGNVETLADSGEKENLYADGRVAFYAKGQIAGKWLLTAAYDSAKQRQVGTSLFNQIDPQTYFTLYGDASQQGYDAASARKIYVKIEREQFYALFGDYDTGLTVTELSRYSRRMNGFKAELRTRNVEVNAFGAKSDQTYVHDEIPGDGTSGLYHLTRSQIVLNSETVTLVTRDRYHSEVILDSRSLARFTDYSIDYDAGTIFFREPIASRDFNFNPITIVVEYESAGAGVDDITAGGRAGVKLLDQRLRAGVTVVHEGEGTRKDELYGADARLDLTENTRIRSEVAVTNQRVNGVSTKGDAFLAELAHASRTLDGKLYFREEQGAFGLGQQLFSEAGTRKWGGDATYRFDERLSLSGQAYRQDTFSNGAERLFGEGRIGWNTRQLGAYAGLLEAHDRLVDGSIHESGQLTAGGKARLLGERLTLGLDYAQSVWGNGSADFPTRIGLHAEYKLTEHVSLLAADELTWGDGATTNHARASLRSELWKGGSLTTGVERDLNENDERVFGNIGLRQTLRLTDAWKADAGVERSQTLLHNSGIYQLNPAFPPAVGSVTGESFTAASVGANYQVKSFVWDSRVEGRHAASGDKYSLTSGLVAELTDGWAFSGRAQIFGARQLPAHTLGGDLRFGMVYRPERTRWILLNRLDFLFDRQTGSALDTDDWRVVNNFMADWRPRKELQVALAYGARYARTLAAGAAVAGYTDELGVELRYDVTELFDIGARASVLHAWAENQVAWSGGPSVGVSPATNVWIGAGVNIAGYDERDFTAAGFQSRGPYVRLRLKFDQQSVRDAAAYLNRQ